jgi:hypothetical protein
MSGIYVLCTKDGYRVNYYANSYYDLIDVIDGSFVVDGIKKVFDDCRAYDDYEDAIYFARKLSLNYSETDDGIRVINVNPTVDYGELKSGSFN